MILTSCAVERRPSRARGCEIVEDRHNVKLAPRSTPHYRMPIWPHMPLGAGEMANHDCANAKAAVDLQGPPAADRRPSCTGCYRGSCCGRVGLTSDAWNRTARSRPFRHASSSSSRSPSKADARPSSSFMPPHSSMAVHWNGTFWKQVATPSPGRDTNELTGVRVLSANDAWAVGDTFGHGVQQTLILHWNGTRWTRVASPSPGCCPGLAAVAATSASNAWAVGSTGNGTLILHWNGTKWTHVASPSLGGLRGVAATSGSNAWAVGFFYNGALVQQTLILHWNGARWRRVASPNPGGSADENSLSGVAVTSAGNAWAVGRYLTGPASSKTLILRWNGSKWARVASPDPGTSNQLNAVRAWSASNAWAVGSFMNGGPSQALAIHCC